jgi:hypothetical protein
MFAGSKYDANIPAPQFDGRRRPPCGETAPEIPADRTIANSPGPVRTRSITGSGGAGGAVLSVPGPSRGPTFTHKRGGLNFTFSGIDSAP